MPQHKLQERVKELSCLYAVARIAQAPDRTLENMLQAIIAEIPQGYQFPEQALAHLRFDAQDLGTVTGPNQQMQTSVLVNGEPRGMLSVGYPESMGETEGPLFLPEERQLLGKLAIEVALVIERYEHREQQASLQSHLRTADRLAILGEITSGIAHELNSPLGNVLGFAELLKKEEIDPAKKADLQRIVDSALIGRGIVKKLMYFSCEMPSQFLALDANQAIKDTVRLLSQQLTDRDTRMEWHLAEALPMIHADAIQFSQVITNLVLNAVDAMGTNGQLCISTEQNDDTVMIHIKDSGDGIAPAHIKKLFQPFFTTKPTGKGTGLGLSVVHGIMKGHKGDISVASEPGHGTKFTLTFPLAE